MKPARVFCYVMAASGDPEAVRCSVPWHVNNDVVFFGPCKKRTRKLLRSDYLGTADHREIPDENVYLLAFNGSKDNPQRIRKIVFFARCTELMTFQFAYDNLTSREEGCLKLYGDLHPESERPLHLKPIVDSGALVGYRHVGKLHAAGAGPNSTCKGTRRSFPRWVSDLTSRERSNVMQLEGENLFLIDPEDRYDVFDRDICFLAQNIVFAGRKGSGLNIDAELLEFFRDCQPDRADEIESAWYVFGKQQNGKPYGRPGSHLELRDTEAARLIELLRQRAEFRLE